MINGKQFISKSAAPSAFTLVELLVVLGIIGILAAFLLPVYVSAKWKAQQAICLSNLKQMGLANALYMNDSHGKCLPYSGQRGLWMAALVDYQSKVDSIRFCPVAVETNTPDNWGRADKAWRRNPDTDGKVWSGSYAMNGWLFSDLTNLPPEENALALERESNIRRPSVTPLFSDSVWDDCWPRTNDPPAHNLYKGYHGKGSDGKIGRVTIPRHNFSASRAPTSFDTAGRLPGTINVTCFDGHVELSHLENLWNFYWNK